MNFKKLVCVILALLILTSAFSITAFASDTVEFVSNQLHFDSKTTGWNNYKKIFCHIWEYGGDSFYAWQSKKEACSDKDGDGIWTYDLDAKGIVFEEDKLYAVVFSNENGLQTYNLLLDSTVIGDTAYCDGTIYENPEDSTKTTQAAFWKNQDKTVFGPELCITSIGNVVGTCVPSVVSKNEMFENFLLNTLENARVYSGKDDQHIIDDVAKEISLTKQEVEEAIYNTGIVVDWDINKSTLSNSGYVPKPPLKPENPFASPDQVRVEWAVDNYKNNVDPELKTNRLYFLMPNGTNGNKCDDNVENGDLCDEYPNSWYNEYAKRASIYWSDTGKLDPYDWPGYTAAEGDSVDVYYADVPEFVDSFFWNNGIIYSTEKEESMLYAAHTTEIPCKYEKGESKLYPEGLDNFNNMIYVITPHSLDVPQVIDFELCVGEWYYYYGDGCYGIEKNGTDFDCIRDDHTHNDNIYVVAGAKEMCESAWDPAYLENRMHYNAENDVYEKVFTDVPIGIHEFTIAINRRFIDPEDFDMNPPKFGPPSWGGNADVTVEGSTVIITFDAKTLEAEVKVIAKDPVDNDLLGDVDGDGEVSVMDATAIQLFKAQLKDIDEERISLADTDKDGEVSVLDATQIQLYKAQLIPSL
ncbi:MAG: hypothetical protein IKB73_00965 [Ruminococcus sp.]|nr:hypothetical protein [Ruminococcus sp.]